MQIAKLVYKFEVMGVMEVTDDGVDEGDGGNANIDLPIRVTIFMIKRL